MTTTTADIIDLQQKKFEQARKLALDKIEDSKVLILGRQDVVFWITIISSLKLNLSNPAVPTAATDGITMWMNPEFLEDLSVEEVAFLILHEAGHVIYFHVDKHIYGDLDQRLLNIAGDQRINNDLASWGFKMPNGGHCDPKYRDPYIWSTIKIYEDLEQTMDPDEQPAFDDIVMIAAGSGDGDGDPEDGEGTGLTTSGLSPEEHREKLISNVLKAAQVAQITDAAGSIPAGVQRILDDMLNPQVPWYQMLRRHMNDQRQDDYDPNCRDPYFQDVFVEDLYSEGLGQVFVSIDASGSMTDDDIEQTASEIRYIQTLLEPSKLHVVSHDTTIGSEEIYERGEAFKKLNIVGGGGTSLYPVVELIEKNQPELILFFTDGYFRMPDLKKVRGDIYWIIANNRRFKAPKGYVIHID